MGCASSTSMPVVPRMPVPRMPVPQVPETSMHKLPVANAYFKSYTNTCAELQDFLNKFPRFRDA